MIRGATATDYTAYAKLFRELAIAEPTPSYERWASELARGTLVADRDGRVEGYVDFYALSEAGHIRNLVVSPEARNSGVGAELMRAAADRLREGGIFEWHLSVKQDNTAAIRLYEKLGFEVEHRSTVFRMPWSIAGALPSEPAIASEVSPGDDDDLERELDMLSGRVAMTRRRNATLIQLRDASCAAAGFAAYDTGSGASPFRVARPQLIGTLLAALRPHATGPHIQIVMEDCPACTRVLVEAGAELRLELLHYRGRLA